MTTAQDRDRIKDMPESRRQKMTVEERRAANEESLRDFVAGFDAGVAPNEAAVDTTRVGET